MESSNDYSLLSLVLWLLTKIIAHLPPGSNAAAGLHHGCPFKNFDETQLRVTLQQLQVANSEIGEIVAKVKGQHYQIACGKYSTAASTLHCCPYPYPFPLPLPLPLPLSVPTSTPAPGPDTLTALTHLTSLPRYFEAKHKGSTLIETELGGISHPNQYFEQVPLRPCCAATPLPRHTSSPCHPLPRYPPLAVVQVLRGERAQGAGGAGGQGSGRQDDACHPRRGGGAGLTRGWLWLRAMAPRVTLPRRGAQRGGTCLNGGLR